MKKAKSIISHIKKTPLYQQSEDLQVFKSLLPKKYQNLIAFAYLKFLEDESAILMIALYHPTGLSELKRDSSIKEIKELLKIYVNFNPHSELKKVQDIKLFVLVSFIKRNREAASQLEAKKQEFQESYIERAEGKFKNAFKDEKLHELFELLREKIILNNKEE